MNLNAEEKKCNKHIHRPLIQIYEM